MKYTEAQRAETLELYAEIGTIETHRRTGIPSRTILDWAGKAGIVARAESEKMAEAKAARHAAKRDAIRELLLDRTTDFLEHMNPDDPRGTQSLATSVGILIDKYRLEMGEHTQRTDAFTSVDMELQRALDEFRRQSTSPHS